MAELFRCGLVAVVGRPNVGKSTLVNRLVRKKISITSQLPQTTRTRLLGIKTDQRAQIVYVDTPGFHSKGGNVLNRYMSRATRGSLEGVDCIVLVASATGRVGGHDSMIDLIREQACPTVFVLNMIDKLKGRAELLPRIKQASEWALFAEIIPLSALTGENVTDLENSVIAHLPTQPMLFPSDQITDRNDRFMAAELVREQVFRNLRQEVPYAVAVGIEQFQHRNNRLHVNAVIWVDQESQKGIVIGRHGERLKLIGTHAREQMEQRFDCKVYLGLWVKVREGWANSEELLRSLHYGEE